MRLMIFDLPLHKGNFNQRITAIQQIITAQYSPYLVMVPQFKLNSTAAIYAKLDEIISMQGEGIMLHHQAAYYRVGRNSKLMKLKRYQDDEAIVIKHFSGKGKYTDQLGALLVEDKNGLRFKIGSGFTDKERKHPPPIGTTVTFKFVGKTLRGVPRFASYLRIREE